MKPRKPTARGRVPLERALSKLGIASRTQARAWIEAGRVSISGRKITNPLQPVTPETARIEIDGKPVEAPEGFTIAFHRPRGVVTTRSDEKGRPTVYGLLEGLPCPVHAVGRLDMATTGLLLFTNDTRLSDWLTDPASGIPRTYVVTVRGLVDEATVERLLRGVMDQGELLRPDALSLRKSSGRESHLVVTLKEGKNREIRRLFSSAGHEVTRLKRISFGAIELGELPSGKWREISAEELRRAFPGAPLRRERG